METSTLRSVSLFEVKTSLGAPHTYILFLGSELVSCDTVKSFAAQAKIGNSSQHSENRSQQAKIKGVEFFSGASKKQSNVCHLSILNLHCTVNFKIIEHTSKIKKSIYYSFFPHVKMPF
jgi:hypothetical protein